MRFDVEMRTLDSYGFTDVRILKIDTEGTEMEVIEGGRETILRDRPALIVELLTGTYADPVSITADDLQHLWLCGDAGDQGRRTCRRPSGYAQSGQQHHMGFGDPQSQRSVHAAK